MAGGLLKAILQASVKRKIFVSYHHRGDQAHYDKFSEKFCDDYDVVTDNSLERAVDSEDPDYVIRRIRENHITGTSCTILLVGNSTWGRKYIDWEINATLEKEHGLIGVCLPTLQPQSDGLVKVPPRLLDNIDSGYAVWVSWAAFTANAEACTGYIEHANTRDKKLIVNNRDRRLQDA